MTSIDELEEKLAGCVEAVKKANASIAATKQTCQQVSSGIAAYGQRSVPDILTGGATEMDTAASHGAAALKALEQAQASATASRGQA